MSKDMEFFICFWVMFFVWFFALPFMWAWIADKTGMAKRHALHELARKQKFCHDGNLYELK